VTQFIVHRINYVVFWNINTGWQ